MRPPLSIAFALTFGLSLAALSVTALAQPSCRAVSGASVPTVVELYTSEGCNSCPPADHWLIELKSNKNVLRAAFHVDYWDRQGWRDRFGSAAYSARQAQSQRWSGARYSYTPQVQVNGQDWPQWPRLPDKPMPSMVDLSLVRGGDDIKVIATARPGAPAHLSLWWAVLEDGLWSSVRAGENAGVTLRHDAVVRRYGTEAPWDSAHALDLVLPAPDPGLRLLVVVVDATTHQTAQALELSCPG
ncbi:MAG TPA: DUF1223 domain-containing protein [Burkholderiaceae bacterium]|jgi:hypothetical protein